MSTYLSAELRSRIEQADRRRCCYCHTSEANSGIPLTHDHIVPLSKGGGTSFENVCLACRPCNEFKADAMEAVDPATGEVVSLFNPRTASWSDHFTWSTDTAKVEGQSPTGRATVIALRMMQYEFLMDRVTATFDAETIAAIRRIAGPRGISAFLQAAARERLARLRLLEMMDDLDAKHGAPSEQVRAEVDADARRVFRR